MLTPTQQAYKTIKQTLTAERRMRVLVFRESKKQEEKTAEIDAALAALDVLAEAIKLAQAQGQFQQALPF
jgi:regulator of protease activity HflC (stomatin/prohibitin superfamily)